MPLIIFFLLVLSLLSLQVEEVELIDKKGYLTISLSLAKEGSKILLRKPEGIREWYQDLRVRDREREKVQGDTEER